MCVPRGVAADSEAHELPGGLVLGLLWRGSDTSLRRSFAISLV